MTEGQVKRWLGFPPAERRQLRPEIIEGMRGVPWPMTAGEQMEAFRTFLRCWPEGERTLFAPEGP